MYIKPVYSDIKDLVKKRDDYNNVLEKARDIKSKREQILSTYNSLSDQDKARLEKVVSERFDGVILANHLNSIANKYGMIINEVKNLDTNQATSQDPSIAAMEPLYKTHKMSFSVEGKYENFVPFLSDIENNFNILDINSLDISTSKDPKKNDLRFEIKFQTYSLN